MKFQKLEAFEKHFKEAYPQHLSTVYAIISPQEGERKKILSSLIQLLEKDCDFKRCQEVKETIDHLNNGSLFSQKVAACFDGVHLLLKTELELLIDYISFPNPEGILLLGGENAKQISELYKKGKKEIVILDLSKEKPWEEKQRLQKWVVQMLSAQKKDISSEAVDLLFKRLPADRILLQQELDKLICYTLDRPAITRADVEVLCSPMVDLNVFEFAQGLIWGKPPSIPHLNDLSVILPIIGLLRSQLEMGLKMGALLKKGAGQEEIGQVFPRLWPKALQQCLNGTRQKGLSFFKKGLMALFELELGLKTSRAKPGVLFTAFCSQIISEATVS